MPLAPELSKPLRTLPVATNPSEEAQIRVWLAARRAEFRGHVVDMRFRGGNYWEGQVRLAVLIEQAEHALANLRARKIVEQFERVNR